MIREPMVGLSVGRSPYGERGLKFIVRSFDGGWRGRSPYGERGLKLQGTS